MKLFLVVAYALDPSLTTEDHLVVWATKGEQALDLFEHHCRTQWKMPGNEIASLALWAYEMPTTQPATPNAVCWTKLPACAERRTEEPDRCLKTYRKVL